MSSKLSGKQVAEAKQLYSLCLDLTFSIDCLKDRVVDITDDLKDAKKRLAKANKDLEKVKARYKEVEGREFNYKPK